jgi:hypothetical protein
MIAVLGNNTWAAAEYIRSAGMVGAVTVVEMYTRMSAELSPVMLLPRRIRRMPEGEIDDRPQTKAAPWVGWRCIGVPTLVAMWVS